MAALAHVYAEHSQWHCANVCNRVLVYVIMCMTSVEVVLLGYAPDGTVRAAFFLLQCVFSIK